MDTNDIRSRVEQLAQELGLIDWREWLEEWGEEAVFSGVVGLDWNSLPFGSVGD
jgi:hypothetical protein